MPNPVIPYRPRGGRFIALAGLFSVTAFAASDPIGDVSKMASDWVKTRAETVRIENAWAQDRSLLTSTIGGLQERVARLQDRHDHLMASTAEERTEQATLGTKLTESRASLQTTETRLLALTDKVLRLRPLLPPRLADALEMSYRSLEGKDASPSERMQLVMTVLNRCAQFNVSITHGEEILTLQGEPGPKAVDVIYWGLSHGYALDRAGGKVWLGTPGPERWQWEPLPDAAATVAELMAIRLDQADPRLVSIPARLKANP